MKKFLSLILVFALVLSMSSVALAEAATPTDASGKVTTEEQLVQAIAEGGDIVLGGNVTLSKTLTIPAGSNVTLNLGGYALMFTTDFAGTTALIENKGTLTIEGSGKISNTANNPDTDWDPEGFPTYANNTIKNSGKLTVNGGTIENNSVGGACYAIDNYTGGDVEINGGEILNHNNVAIRQFIGSNNNVTINGGTVTGKRAVWMHLAGSEAVDAPKASLKVTGGTLTSNKEGELAIYIYSYGNSNDNIEVEVSGGVVNSPIGLMGGEKNGTPKVSISGGSIADVYDYSNRLTGIISGGTFGAEPNAALVAAGKVAAQSGDKWVVADKVNVSFNANGGTGDMDAQTFGKGVAQTLTANAFTRNGYTFTGWNTNANGEGTTYADKAEEIFNADTALYAQWKKEFTVENFTPVTPPTSSDPSDEPEVTVTIQDVTVEMEEEEVDEILESVLEDGEKAEDTAIYLEVKEVSADNDEVKEDQKVIDKKFGEDEDIIAYLDINLFKQTGDETPEKVEELKNNKKIAITIELSEVVEGYTYYIIRVHNGVADRLNGTLDGKKFTFYTDRFSTYALASEKTPVSSGSGISVTYNGGNSFSTSNPSVPTSVEIDGVPVTFNGNGSNFTVGCINPGAKWVTVKWQSTTVTTNFTPDGLVECATVAIPKTGGMSIWAAIAEFLGF